MGTKTMSPESMDIHGLSDEDLYQQILSYGVNIGPVVASTRFLYEKKLYELILSVNSTTHNVPDVTPLLPPAAAEPEVPSIIHQRAKDTSPMRTEVAGGGPRPNTACSAPVAEVTLETQKPKKPETKEIVREPVDAPSAAQWTSSESGSGSFVAEELYRTPVTEISARRALYSNSPSTPNARFSGFGNGIQAKSPAAPQKVPAATKTGFNFTLIIEIGIITALLVVGFLFLREMQSLDEAVKNDL